MPELKSGQTRYPPIEDYGIVGDLNTAALVGRNGSVDFLCYPAFDSPSVFARLLDHEEGGHFSLLPELGTMRTQQLYVPDTNILLTRFLSRRGVVEVTDCMPIDDDGANMQLIRIVRLIAGDVRVQMRFAPRFDYGRASHRFVRDESGECLTVLPSNNTLPPLRLFASVPLTAEGRDVTSAFVLAPGEEVRFVLSWSEKCPDHACEAVQTSLQKTTRFWRDWIRQSNYDGRWRETVNRSALLLKLLTYRKTGALVSAPTFGLPEALGGKRNWDYRYCWIRDSAFAIYALIRLGFHQEAIDYVKWVEARFRESNPNNGRLFVMYRIDGTRDLEEQTLDAWEGYRESRPVRVGNAAVNQLQLDIYGELLDSVYLANKYVTGISHEAWQSLVRIVDYVCDHWQEPDHGIWEMRGKPQHFLHSRLMCWVALDRAYRLALSNSLPASLPRWAEARAAIYRSIFDEFWNEELQAFVQHKGAATLDASVLMMPMVKFIAYSDPKWLSTLNAIGETLGMDALIRRYLPPPESMEGVDTSAEGSFTMCSFWYIECLARSGQVEKATLLFEKMLCYASPLGLYSEQLNMDGGHLGNYPQAFTHLALISAAYALNLKMNDKDHHAWRF